jgi:hypothetical protein
VCLKIHGSMALQAETAADIDLQHTEQLLKHT